MPVNKICEVCGNVYHVKQSHTKKRHTCSNECRYKRHSQLLMGHEYWGGHLYQKGHPAYGGFETRYTKENHPEPWNRGLKGKSGVVLSEETRRKISEAKKGIRRPDLTRMNKEPNFIKKRMKGLHNGLTEPEKTVKTMIEEKKLPFKYVGDGEEVIGSFIPDFIHTNGEKKIIEVFGRTFHDPDVSHLNVSWNRQYWGRKAIYGQFGYDCLILWDDELGSKNHVLKKINDFLEVEVAN